MLIPFGCRVLWWKISLASLRRRSRVVLNRAQITDTSMSLILWPGEVKCLATGRSKPFLTDRTCSQNLSPRRVFLFHQCRISKIELGKRTKSLKVNQQLTTRQVITITECTEWKQVSCSNVGGGVNLSLTWTIKEHQKCCIKPEQCIFSLFFLCPHYSPLRCSYVALARFHLLHYGL